MDDKSTSPQDKNSACGSNLTWGFLLDLRGKQDPWMSMKLQPCFTTIQIISLIINAAKWALLGTNQSQAIGIFWHQSSPKDLEACRIHERHNHTLPLGIFLITKITRWMRHACTKYRYVKIQVLVIQEPYRLQKLSLSHSSLQISHLNHGLQLILPENLVELKVSIIIRPNLPLALFPALPFTQHVIKLWALG